MKTDFNTHNNVNRALHSIQCLLKTEIYHIFKSDRMSTKS